MSFEAYKRHLHDIIENCRHIEDFIRNMDAKTFEQSVAMTYAVERAVLIISEAVRRYEIEVKRGEAPKSLIQDVGETNWKNIKGIGNIIRHDYEDVSKRLMWQVATEYAPRLKRCCLSLLEQA